MPLEGLPAGVRATDDGVQPIQLLVTAESLASNSFKDPAEGQCITDAVAMDGSYVKAHRCAHGEKKRGRRSR
jgi:hypothetical protein